MDAPPLCIRPTRPCSSYGLGKLDDASAEAVSKHLEDCPDCRQPRRRDVVGQLPRPAPRRRGRGPAPRRPVGTSPARREADAGGRMPPASAPGRARCPRAWPTTPTTRSSASWAAAAWASSTWPRTGSWAARRSSRSSAATSSSRRGVLDRFLREIRAAARLHHPNIVTAYSAFRLGESIVFAMEYVEGLDLAQAGQGQRARCRWPTPATSSTRRRWACSTPTSTAWSTATSSRAT